MFSSMYFIPFQGLVRIYYLSYVDNFSCLGQYFFSVQDQKGIKDLPKFCRDVAT